MHASPVETPLSSDLAPSTRWKTFGFRFTLCYLALYTLPFLYGFPAPPAVFETVGGWKRQALLAIGTHLFGLRSEDVTSELTFFGVLVATFAALALLGAGVWTWLRPRESKLDAQLRAGLETWLRYVLACSMLLYGLGKVFAMQFGALTPDRLATPVGELSSFQLMWTFMAYSPAYQLFGGVAELVGAALLFSRRTTTAGALLLVGVMGNVAALNFCYDIPVKLDASHDVLIALVLAGPDLAVLAGAFLLGRTLTPAPRPAFLPSWRRGRLATKLAFIGLAVGVNGWLFLSHRPSHAPPSSPLFGVYEVEDFVRSGHASVTDGQRWRRVSIDKAGASAWVDRPDGTGQGYDLTATATALTLTPEGAGSGHTWTLRLSRPDSDHLELEGPLEEGPLRIRLHKLDPARMPLVEGRPASGW